MARRVAAILAAAILAGVALFQVALVLGAPWGEYTQGGSTAGSLPAGQRAVAAVSAVLLLVMAGALGNLIDRVRLGYVIDFLHVHYGDAWHFPIFNMADVAINIGVALILIDAFLLESKRNTL